VAGDWVLRSGLNVTDRGLFIYVNATIKGLVGPVWSSGGYLNSCAIDTVYFILMIWDVCFAGTWEFSASWLNRDTTTQSALSIMAHALCSRRRGLQHFVASSHPLMCNGRRIVCSPVPSYASGSLCPVYCQIFLVILLSISAVT
jgi:hypothetical protein